MTVSLYFKGFFLFFEAFPGPNKMIILFDSKKGGPCVRQEWLPDIERPGATAA
jgi:hypothetical protein